MRGKGIDRERSLVLIIRLCDWIRKCLDRVEEGKRFSNEKKDPITSKEMKEEQYEVKISSTVL
ncbi:hypothetical protein J1N35_008879 [Gossypium stocksii]|uniref:Uncharacterized protein n=1 Tax=Gossypium stocksii TaxID=47602 RepID=A0A9D4AH41_9ROSI|nr:hypothetical protein J1N35_008879 [Gossypium stocksii]